jgi:hypothetical protein
MKNWNIVTGILVALTFLSGNLFGQYSRFGPHYTPSPGATDSFVVDSAGNIRFNPGKTSYNISMGTSFMTGFNGGSVFTTYVAPEFSYNISERFRLSGGVSVMNNFGSGISDSYYPGFFIPGQGGMATFYASGEYLLSNKLSLTGTVYKDFSLYEPVSSPIFRQNEGHGMMLDLNYRPTRNMQINATIQIDRGRGAWGYPGSPWMHGNPFHPGGGYYRGVW